MAQCEGCKGAPCQKAVPDYYKTSYDGENYKVTRCEYYEDEKIEKIEMTEPKLTFSSKKNNADLVAQLQALSLEYAKKYKLEKVTKEQTAEIALAEVAIAKCELCNGECIQEYKYKKPRIRIKKGKVVIEKDYCEYGKIKLKEKSKEAQVPPKYIGKTFSEYETTAENYEALQIAHWYLEDKPKCSLYFYGECGSGKTFLAAITAQELIRDGKKVIFGDVPSLLDRIKAEFNRIEGNAQEVLDSYSECDMLILDDFGAGYITDWNVGILYQIINNRYNAKKPVIITSNLDLEGLENRLAFKDALTAKRITSRISEMCELAFFGLKDRRKQKC